MTSGEHRDDRHLSETTGEPKRKLAMWLAVLALILTILLFIFFWWWQREGEETEPEDVTRIELVDRATWTEAYLLVA